MNHIRDKRHLNRFLDTPKLECIIGYRQRQWVLTLARRGVCATLNAVLVCQTVSVREIRDVL